MSANPIQLTASDYSQMKLPELAGCIWSEASLASSAMESAAKHAIACGGMLEAAKRQVPHGAWMKWLKDNTQLSQSTANTYMRVAANSQRAVNLESIRGALRLLAQDKLESRDDFSEDYIPFDGEELPSPPPDPAPAFKVRPSVPTVVEAEIVEPSSDPEPLIVDGTSEQPCEPQCKRLSKWIPDDADRLWTLAKSDLDKILKSDRSRERVLREVIKYAQDRLGTKQPHIAFETILDAINHMPKDELSKLKRAIAVQWETLTGNNQ